MDWVIAVFVGSGCCSGLKEDFIFYIFGFWTLDFEKCKRSSGASQQGYQAEGAQQGPVLVGSFFSFAFAVSWATWLPFTGVPARCVVLCVPCPGPLGSCSPVCPLGALCCACGVLGHLAPVHRCARSVHCFARAVSSATGLLFTGVPAQCVVVCVRCPGPRGSCSPVCPLRPLLWVYGVLGHLASVHQGAR